MTESKRDVGAVIVAAGSGRRFGDESALRKQYRLLGGLPLLAWSVNAFLGHPRVAECVVVLPAEDVDAPPAFLAGSSVTRVAGGPERHDSVRNGIGALSPGLKLILVHDGARPLVSREVIDRVIAAAESGAAIPGTRVTDTLKEVAGDRSVISTPDRDRFWQVQTPQGFPARLIRRVHEQARAAGIGGTDDAALFEHFGHPVRIVDGDPNNIKITRPIDLLVAELLIQRLDGTGRTDQTRTSEGE